MKAAGETMYTRVSLLLDFEVRLPGDLDVADDASVVRAKTLAVLANQYPDRFRALLVRRALAALQDMPFEAVSETARGALGRGALDADAEHEALCTVSADLAASPLSEPVEIAAAISEYLDDRLAIELAGVSAVDLINAMPAPETVGGSRQQPVRH